MTIRGIIDEHGGVEEAAGVYRFPRCRPCTDAFVELQAAFPDRTFAAVDDYLFVIEEI